MTTYKENAAQNMSARTAAAQEAGLPTTNAQGEPTSWKEILQAQAEQDRLAREETAEKLGLPKNSS